MRRPAHVLNRAARAVLAHGILHAGCSDPGGGGGNSNDSDSGVTAPGPGPAVAQRRKLLQLYPQRPKPPCDDGGAAGGAAAQPKRSRTTSGPAAAAAQPPLRLCEVAASGQPVRLHFQQLLGHQQHQQHPAAERAADGGACNRNVTAAAGEFAPSAHPLPPCRQGMPPAAAGPSDVAAAPGEAPWLQVMPVPVRPTTAASLLDDPRAYETPEVLAALLYQQEQLAHGGSDAATQRRGTGNEAAGQGDWGRRGALAGGSSAQQEAGALAPTTWCRTDQAFAATGAFVVPSSNGSLHFQPHPHKSTHADQHCLGCDEPAASPYAAVPPAAAAAMLPAGGPHPRHLRPDGCGGGEGRELLAARVGALREELAAAERLVASLKGLVAEAEADLGRGFSGQWPGRQPPAAAGRGGCVPMVQQQALRGVADPQVLSNGQARGGGRWQ